MNGNSKLHVFVDACKSSYGACVYIRTVTPFGVKIRLIRAMSGVVPFKNFDYSPTWNLWLVCIWLRGWFTRSVCCFGYRFKIVAWVTQWWLRTMKVVSFRGQQSHVSCEISQPGCSWVIVRTTARRIVLIGDDIKNSPLA
ncbi:hypothetical protein TNIN_389721 [Trichonephila inaurata madagascariensis]|uniref:Uncharacterized protein n=1 Tax=Trichonephila inaurata madagascariensis TaxID=2747483 RepID=A0A8X6X2C0_9ARAC|nr:hypothetical protein TNIN_389721 [Trichonephila inaurata madagascariensis]